MGIVDKTPERVRAMRKQRGLTQGEARGFGGRGVSGGWLRPSLRRTIIDTAERLRHPGRRR